MNALTILAAILCAAAFLYLGAVLHRRYPAQPHEAGKWRAPTSAGRWAGREPGFDRTVDRIEMAKGSGEDWRKLVDHLDAIAAELDPAIAPGTRSAVRFRRWARILPNVQRTGTPRTYNRHYVDARLTAIEQRNGGTPRG